MQDSKSATMEHKAEVKRVGTKFVRSLEIRLIVHDKSKLKDPEKRYLDQFSEKLKGYTYMSDEYKEVLEKMEPGLDHHYTNNDHHPQFYKIWICDACLEVFKTEPEICKCGDSRFSEKSDVSQMSLLSIMEMIIDWCAAVKRHDDGNILHSIEENQKRYGYGDELKQIFINTVKEMGCE